MNPLKKPVLPSVRDIDKDNLKKLMSDVMGKPMPKSMRKDFDMMDLKQQIQVVSSIAQGLLEKSKPSFISRALGLDFGAKKVEKYTFFLQEVEKIKKEVEIKEAFTLLKITPKAWESTKNSQEKFSLLTQAAADIRTYHKGRMSSQKSGEIILAVRTLNTYIDHKTTQKQNLKDEKKQSVTEALKILNIPEGSWNQKKLGPEQFRVRYEILHGIQMGLALQGKKYDTPARKEAFVILNNAMNEDEDQYERNLKKSSALVSAKSSGSANPTASDSFRSGHALEQRKAKMTAVEISGPSRLRT